MRVTITCEDCGERHRLERQISEPGPIWIVCHACELPLQAVLDGPAPTPTQTHAVWSGILDLSPGVRPAA
ncbi:MAG: hypothetical protein ACRENL_08495 [Candidatus Dormibacteria bacterium]